MVMDHHWFEQQKLDTLRHNVLLVIMPVFFLSTGLRTGWSMGGTAVFVAAALLLQALAGGWHGPQGRPWQFVLGVGMACAVTALPILFLFLEKLDILRRPLGQRILRYASLDDVAIWGVLALVLMDWERIGRQATFIAVFAIACVGFRRLMVRLPERDRGYVALIWLAATLQRVPAGRRFRQGREYSIVG